MINSTFPNTDKISIFSAGKQIVYILSVLKLSPFNINSKYHCTFDTHYVFQEGILKIYNRFPSWFKYSIDIDPPPHTPNRCVEMVSIFTVILKYALKFFFCYVIFIFSTVHDIKENYCNKLRKMYCIWSKLLYKTVHNKKVGVEYSISNTHLSFIHIL